ncbi:class I mannose-6-phosphate isomerase [Sphingomonas daechungensis]|uniref:class I mannose-6-phosphate isomerase n=2 Tax=Sphingomonas daechungensis TaxID=1176646 RepID=UPI0031F12B3D
MLTKLQQHRVSKPWGRTDVPEGFGPSDGDPLGEIWFQREGADDPLLIKYLFTSERLSVQVHPDDAAAQTAGLARGKDEAWIVLSAHSNGELGIGLRSPVSPGELRAAAMDGSIVDLVDWRKADAGDAYYSPAGTVHALGPGLTVLEVQQNSDVTYRLYDYGRPRELHLDKGIDAARSDLVIEKVREREIDQVRSIAVAGPKFTVERWRSGAGTFDATDAEPAWLIPIKGTIAADGQALVAPDVWIAEGRAAVEVGPDSELLVAYEGTRLRAVA